LLHCAFVYWMNFNAFLKDTFPPIFILLFGTF